MLETPYEFFSNLFTSEAFNILPKILTFHSEDTYSIACLL